MFVNVVIVVIIVVGVVVGVVIGGWLIGFYLIELFIIVGFCMVNCGGFGDLEVFFVCNCMNFILYV